MKNNNTVIILLVLSILFIPAAYIYAIVLFIGLLLEKRSFYVDSFRNNKVICITGIWCIIVTLLCKYKLVSSFFLLMIIICIITMLYIANCDKLPSGEEFLRVLYIVALVTYAIGIIQMLIPNLNMPSKWVDASQYNIDKRMFSTFFNPNVYGFFINIVILCIVTNMGSTDRSKQIIILENITLPLSILCLFFTFSRTSWISLVCSLFILSLLTERRYLKYVIIITLFLLAADRISNTGRIEFDKIAKDGSFAYRLELWRTSLGVIKDNLLHGIGFGTFYKYTSQYSVIITHYVEHCHNIYLQIIMETGIVGFLLFIYTVYNVFKTVYINLKRKNNYIFYKIVALIAIMTLIHGTIDSVPLTPQIMFLLSIFMGVYINKSKKVASEIVSF